MDQQSPEPIPPDHQLPSTTGDAAKPPHKRRQWLWVLLLLAFALILVLFLRHHDDGKKSAAAAGGRRGMGVPIDPDIALLGAGNGQSDAIGTVTPVYTASNYNQVT